MKKKLEEKLETVKEESKKEISKFDLDFGREDLNKLKDKVNEIIDSL